MDFSTGPWPWIVLGVSMTGLLLWFALGMVERGLAFHRAQFEAQGREELHALMRSMDSRISAIERCGPDANSNEERIRRIRTPRNGSG